MLTFLQRTFSRNNKVFGLFHFVLKNGLVKSTLGCRLLIAWIYYIEVLLFINQIIWQKTFSILTFTEFKTVSYGQIYFATSNFFTYDNYNFVVVFRLGKFIFNYYEITFLFIKLCWKPLLASFPV